MMVMMMMLLLLKLKIIVANNSSAEIFTAEFPVFFCVRLSRKVLRALSHKPHVVSSGTFIAVSLKMAFYLRHLNSYMVILSSLELGEFKLVTAWQ